MIISYVYYVDVGLFVEILCLNYREFQVFKFSIAFNYLSNVSQSSFVWSLLIDFAIFCVVVFSLAGIPSVSCIQCYLWL